MKSYESMTVSELQQLCRSREINFVTRDRKSGLIEKLRALDESVAQIDRLILVPVVPTTSVRWKKKSDRREIRRDIRRAKRRGKAATEAARARWA